MGKNTCLSPCDGHHFGDQMSIVRNVVEDIYSLLYKGTQS